MTTHERPQTVQTAAPAAGGWRKRGLPSVITVPLALMAITLGFFRDSVQRFLLDLVKRSDPQDIPRRIEEELPCKERCKVTSIVVLDDWFSVTVLSEEVEGRLLVYRFGITDAELGFSSDNRMASTYFDHRAIDWSVLERLKEGLNRVALRGRKVTDVMIRPCNPSEKERPARPCMEAEVTTPKGSLSRVVDASTGELVREHP
jgi:hypothetical protein